MPLSPQDLRILAAVRRSKLHHGERERWVSAMDLVSEIRRSPDELARAMRDLALRDYLTQAPKVVMYGSSNDPTLTRYGLTPEGARMAERFSSPNGKHEMLKSQVLQTLQRYRLDMKRVIMTVGELQSLFNVDQNDLIRALRDLEAEGYVKAPFFAEASPDMDHYQITDQGYALASHLKRGGDWPVLGGTQSHQTNTTNNFHGPNQGVIQFGNQNTATVTNTNPVSQELITLIKELQDKIMEISDPDIREEGEFHVSRVAKAAEAGNPPEAPLQRLLVWLGTTGQQVQGAAVIWGLTKAIGDLAGLPLPAAPADLGQ